MLNALMYRYVTMGRHMFPQKIILPLGDLDLHVIYDSLGSHESVPPNDKTILATFLSLSLLQAAFSYKKPARGLEIVVSCLAECGTEPRPE